MRMSASIRVAVWVALGGISSLAMGQDRPAARTAEKPAEKVSPDRGAPDKATMEKYANSTLVTRMMAFDKNGDGKITQDELTDSRMQRLFNRADADKDGVVTKDELIALAMTLEKESGGARGEAPGEGAPREGGPRDGAAPREGGPRDPAAARDGGPREGGPREGGMRDGGPRGGMGQPGQVLPAGLQEVLKLNDDQRKQVAELQKDVDEKLGKILTEDQKKQMKEVQDRRPMGRGRGEGQGRGDGQGRPEGQGRPDGARERAPGTGDQPQRPKAE